MKHLAPDLHFPDDRAGAMLERARWAAGAFAGLDRAATVRIAGAVAEAGFAKAQAYAEWAVRETGFGVVEHKRLKNELCSRGVFEAYAGDDFVGPVVEADRKIVRLARPAGVILALTPSTNPIATLFFKAVLAMLTRNAIVLSPHPAAAACSADAADVLAAAARAAGAPDGAIQVVREPTVPLVTRFMQDPRVDLVLATGGPSVVAAAYRSGHPALGVGPGNAPAFVHETTDIAATAARLVASKSFDNSILCTNESVVLAHAPIADRLLDALRAARAHVCTAEEVAKLRATLWDADGAFNTAALGKDAATIARLAGFPVAPGTLVIVAPIERVQPEEAFAREKLAPVLGFAVVADAGRAAAAARAMMRRAGRGHSAAYHGRDEAALLAFARAAPALRVAVNVPLSQGAAGFGTHLGPSMTVGTGFVGGSSLGDNLKPEHLVNWTQVAYPVEASEPMGRFDGAAPWRARPLPAADAPIPFSQGNPPGAPVPGLEATLPALHDHAALRAEIKEIVLEELRAVLEPA